MLFLLSSRPLACINCYYRAGRLDLHFSAPRRTMLTMYLLHFYLYVCKVHNITFNKLKTDLFSIILNILHITRETRGQQKLGHSFFFTVPDCSFYYGPRDHFFFLIFSCTVFPLPCFFLPI